MAAKPQFAETPNTGIAALAAANTNRDGSGALVVGFTAGADGSRVDRIVVKALGTTTAGVVRAFVHEGAAAKLLTEITVAPAVVAGALPTFETVVDLLGGLTLKAGQSIRYTTHNAEGFNVFTFGGDF